MKFKIYRASSIGSNVCPIDGATREGDGWVIEVADLGDLMRLLEIARDEIIVGLPRGITPQDLPRIAIYDGYME